MDIRVNVINQELKVATNLRERIAAGTQEFVRFVFSMQDDWDGLTVFAQFIQGGQGYNQYLDANNAVFLPSEIGAGKCLMILCGNGGNVKATTNCLILTINDNKFIADAQSTVITKSLYDQLVDIVANNKEEYEEELAIAIDEFEALVETPLIANTAAEMADHTKIYVYAGSETGYEYGHWYGWKNNAWVDGGPYNAQVDIATLAEIIQYITE